MDVIRTLIVDDEPLARQRLRVLLQPERGFRVIGEARDGIEALDVISGGVVDLVFLDIEIPRLDGFELLDCVAGVDLPHVVFVTAFQEHAVRAFDANALDYLVKPFDNERFHRTLDRIQRAVGRGTSQEQLTRLRADLGRYATRLAVRHGSGYDLIEVARIEHVSAERNYVGLHVGGEVRLLRQTMNELQTRLDPAAFVRVHRSAILNISRIRTIEPDQSTEFLITLMDGTRIRSSRTYRRNVAALVHAGPRRAR